MKEPLLHVQSLHKDFYLGKKILHAVKDVSFSIESGEILGLGGESGCGKSTIGKLIMGLINPTEGKVIFGGQDMADLLSEKRRAWRRKMQMIFQHPATSLNPRFTIEEILSEPFIIHPSLCPNRSEQKKQLISLLEQVGLTTDLLERRPRELSGGQQQRIAIARALAVNPLFLIFDEPFSSLDVSVQTQIIHLLIKLHEERTLSYLIISHDLTVLRYFTHKLAIMYLGEIVEWGPSREVYHAPLHPYSQALVSAVLIADPNRCDRSKVSVKGDIPDSLFSSIGCPFAPRCPHAKTICHTKKPSFREITRGRFASCHFV